MFSPPQSFSILPGQKISYLDAQTRTLYQANYSQLNSIQIEKKVNLIKNSTFFLGLIPMANNYFIGVGFMEKNRYAVLDQNGKTLSFNFEYPADDKNSATNFQKAMAYQGGLVANPNGTKCFSYCIYSEIFEILQLQKEGTLTKIKDIHFDKAIYIPEGDGKNSASAVIKKESKMAFLSGAATDKYIYLLYSGRVIGTDFYFALKSNTILVFDWDGNPIIRYNLDVDINTFTVSEDNKIIYAIVNGKEDTYLVKFNL